MYTFCRDFQSFYEVIQKSTYKPPKEIVYPGLHFSMKKDGNPVSCCRLIPYSDKQNKILFYFLGNVYTLDAEKNYNCGFEVCKFTINECKKQLGDIIIIGTVSNKTKEGQVLARYYRKLGGIPASEEFVKYVVENTDYKLDSDLQMMLVEVAKTPF